MTYNEIEEILNSHVGEYGKYDKNIVKDPFLAGLNIISNLSIKRNYACEHDKFYASDFEDMPDITKEYIITLNKLGWSIDIEYGCWFKHV